MEAGRAVWKLLLEVGENGTRIINCQDGSKMPPAVTWRRKWYLTNLSVWLRDSPGRMSQVPTDVS